MPVVFETPRLYVRQFTTEDAPFIFQLNSDPAVIKYIHEPLLTNEEDAAKILINIILPQYKFNLGRWAVYTKQNNEFIGWCGLKYLNDKNITDLGYRLLQGAWGKGFATEAAYQTIIYGLNELKIPMITGMAHAENMASIKVLEKIGMQYQREAVVDNTCVKVYTISSIIKNIKEK